jgi:glutaconate CoA-transferase subunit B
VVMMPRHDARTFVPQVDFRAGVGHLPERDSLGLPSGSGPSLVFSPYGIFDFSGPGRTMSVVSIHADVDRREVAAATGFELHNLDSAPLTPTPSAEELQLLREAVDPRRILVPGPRP